MKEYAQGIQSSELSLVDAPTTSDAPKVTDAAPPIVIDYGRISPAPRVDPFLARAITEHGAGHVDASLWARAVAQGGGDEALTLRTYLNSRATALHVEKRQERAARRALVVDKLSQDPETGFGAEPSQAPKARDDATAKESGRQTRRSGAKRNRWYVIVGTAAIAGVAIVSGFIGLWSASSPAQQANPAKSALPVSVSGRSISSDKTASVAANAGTSAREVLSGEDLVARIQALEKAGNWHLLVIYASEWTRKEPGNPVAWKQLSQGYLKLRQFGEALDAATRATQLAPKDSAMWQNLGQLNTSLQRLPEALVAFQRAAALNDLDVVSLVQIGILSTQLGLLPDAKIAFAKALAVSPEDVSALCGAASIAQKEGRVKDADAMSSLAGGCPDSSPSENVHMAVRAPAQKKLASAGR
jgi:tetratricopeptide (TPR) repeat protein